MKANWLKELGDIIDRASKVELYKAPVIISIQNKKTQFQISIEMTEKQLNELILALVGKKEM